MSNPIGAGASSEGPEGRGCELLCQTNSWSYCDLIFLLRQNKSDDRFSKNSSFNILDSYFRLCLQLLMHKKTRFTNYSKWCRNISWRRQFMIWHHFEFLLTGLLILEILFILYISADFHCPRTCLQNWYPFRKKSYFVKKIVMPFDAK